MSRSQPALQNPARYFMSWSGSRGQLEHYDKEKKVNIPVKFPFEFSVIDHLSTVTGYSEQEKSGFWSNEVRSTTKETLTVRTKNGIQAQGIYADIKDTIKSKGAKYAQSVYIVHQVAGEYVLSNLQISGAALSPWIELSNMHKVEDSGKVILVDKQEDKKGSNTYFVPIFDYDASTAEQDDAAFKADKELQIYLNHYLAAPVVTDEEVAEKYADEHNDVGKASPEQAAEFEQRKKQLLEDKHDQAVGKYQRVASDELGNTDIEDEPINLDDIPF